MISLKRIVYFIDNDTSEDKDKYISIQDMCLNFYDEDLDKKVIYQRIASQIQAYRNMFLNKKDGRRSFWRLSANGYRYLNKFKESYDPINDKQLYEIKKKIEVF